VAVLDHNKLNLVQTELLVLLHCYYKSFKIISIFNFFPGNIVWCHKATCR